MISPEQYEIAFQNGIKKQVVRRRVMHLGWRVEYAIQEPTVLTNDRTFFTKYEEVLLERNEITEDTARRRIKVLGWTREKALNEPTMGRRVKA